MSQQKPQKKKMDKRRLFVTVLVLLLALSLLLPLLSTVILSAGAVTQQEIKDQIASLKEDASDAAAKKKDLENQLAAVSGERAKAAERKSILDQQLAAIDAEIANTESQIEAYNALITEQEAALVEARAQEDYAYDRFCQRARSMEEGGSFSYWSVLFAANSWSDLLDRLALVDEIMVYDNSVVDSLVAAREKVEETLADLRETEAGLEEQKAQQDVQRSEQAAKVAEAEAVLDELKKDEANLRAIHEAAEAEKKRVDAEIAKKEKELQKLVEEAKRAASFTTGSTYTYPLPNSYTRITSGFKWRTCPFHGWEHHNGMDLAAPQGTNIYAVNGGVVLISAYASSSYGNYVMIDHGNGRTTLYAHMSSRTVKQGDIVQAGQVIGYVGHTGSAQGNHLHLELKVNGVRQDPKILFPGVQFTGDLESN